MTEDDALPGALVTDAIAHMNADHADAVLAYARGLAGLTWAERATLTHIDRAGFTLLAVAGKREETVHIPFEPPLAGPEQLRAALIRLARRPGGAVNNLWPARRSPAHRFADLHCYDPSLART